jgi:L-ascorbate metabolism protein UlaG (beta-lactamase superfamily)
MKLTYWGHSCFLIETGTHTLLIDPFLTGNPKAPVSPAQVRCDFILLSHGHNDHLGDTIDIARRVNATVISNHEIVTYCARQGVAGHGMNTGGSHEFPFGRVKMTPAWHSSGYETADGFLYMGNPMGMLITSNGKTIYHAGDTALFGDMKLIGDMHKIDVALLPIGDNYTMGIDDAVKAVEFLRPRVTIPMHYNTFEVIACDPQEFVKKCRAIRAKVEVVEVGKSFEF